MCGIVGYIGKNYSRTFVMEGLSRLEYRGYDSAGFACLKPQQIIRFLYAKSPGRLPNLLSNLISIPLMAIWHRAIRVGQLMVFLPKKMLILNLIAKKLFLLFIMALLKIIMNCASGSRKRDIFFILKPILKQLPIFLNHYLLHIKHFK